MTYAYDPSNDAAHQLGPYARSGELAVDLRATAVPVVEAALLAEGRRPYFLAAVFYYENRINLERAAERMALAPGAGGVARSHRVLHRQALIVGADGDIEAAIEAAEASLAGARKSPQPLRDEYVRLNTRLLERLRR